MRLVPVAISASFNATAFCATATVASTFCAAVALAAAVPATLPFATPFALVPTAPTAPTAPTPEPTAQPTRGVPSWHALVCKWLPTSDR